MPMKNQADQFHKCNFCKEYEFCRVECLKDFPKTPDKSKILETAKSNKISVSDVITLIKL